jgi:8-oxo-dGTP diphosphatase
MTEFLEDSFHLGIKILLQNHKGEILLLEKQHRTKGAFWELPGGRIQKGESVMQALQREVEEETGFKGIEGSFPLDMFLTNIRISTVIGEVGLILSVYRCSISFTFTPQLSSEHTNFGWFSISESVELLKAQYPEAFTEKIARMTFSCLI